MEGSEVEIARRPRIIKMINNFDPGQTNLSCIDIHYFGHESPPDQSRAMEETVDYFGTQGGAESRFRNSNYLIIPDDSETASHPCQQ